MNDWIKAFIIRILSFFYSKVFGEVPGPFALNFMKSLSLIFTGIAISKVFSVIFQVYIGRTLGAFEYGKFAMITSLANFFWLPMIIGIDVALVKFLAGEKRKSEKRAIVSSAVSMTIILTLLSVFMIYLFSPQMASLTAVTQKYVLAAILLGVLNSAWIMSQRIYQGLDKMKKISIMNILLNLTMLIVVVILFLYAESVFMPLMAIALGYFFVSLFVLPELREYFRPSIDRKWAKTLLKYGLAVVVGSVSFSIYTHINKIFLNIFLTFKEVGLYEAYMFSTLNIIGFIVSTLIIVFFPTSSRYKNKAEIYRKINRLLKFTPALFILILAMAAVILFLYGSEYTIIPSLLILFVLTSVANFAFYLHSWFSTSIGIGGAKLSTYAMVTVAVVTVILAYSLIPLFGIYGAIAATAVAFFVGTILIRLKIKGLM